MNMLLLLIIIIIMMITIIKTWKTKIIKIATIKIVAVVVVAVVVVVLVAIIVVVVEVVVVVVAVAEVVAVLVSIIVVEVEVVVVIVIVIVIVIIIIIIIIKHFLTWCFLELRSSCRRVCRGLRWAGHSCPSCPWPRRTACWPGPATRSARPAPTRPVRGRNAAAVGSGTGTTHLSKSRVKLLTLHWKCKKYLE